MMEIGTNKAFSNEFGVQRFQTEEGNKKQLGQEDFLRLIVAQIENQDPFEPAENGEFIGQLAQFGTVDGVNNLNESFAEFSRSIAGNQALNAASLIGKSVQVDGSQVTLTQGEPVTAYVDATGQVGTALVEIRGVTGEVIQTREVPLVNNKLNSFTWNGLDSAGNAVEDGVYFLSATVLTGENELTLPTAVDSEVLSVNLANSQAIELGLQNGETILFDDVQRISQ